MGERVQVNVQLLDGQTGSHVWADRFETDRRDLAEAQSEITGRLARTLNLELAEAVGRQVEREQAANPDARDLVMRGWAWWYRRMSPANRQEAQHAFERALKVDRQSVEAKSGRLRSWSPISPMAGAVVPNESWCGPKPCCSKRSNAIQTARWRTTLWQWCAAAKDDWPNRRWNSRPRLR